MRVLRVGVTPFKGMRHEPLNEVELRADCVAGDRLFALVDPVGRRVVRTVENPRLLAIRARWRDDVLTLEFPGGEVVEDRPAPDGEALDFEYWGRHPGLVPQRTTLAEPLSAWLQQDVRLARITHPGDVVYGAPLTLVTTTDIVELADRASDPRLPDQTSRFRATMVLDDDAEPLAEDSAGRRLRVGGAQIEITGAIPRCAVIDRNPVTGARDRNLLETLASYRRHDGELWFGHYARVVVPGVCGSGAEATTAP